MYKIILIKTFEGLRSEVGHLIKLRISPGKQTKTVKVCFRTRGTFKEIQISFIFLLRVNLNEIGQIQFFFFLFYNNPLCF